MAVATDPSQFAPVNSMAAAASRRINSVPQSILNNLPAAQAQVQPTNSMPGGALAQQMHDTQMANNFTPQNGAQIASSNPLAGGSGDPTLDRYLGTDPTYQGQLSDLLRNYDQYNAQKNLTASQTQADYDAKTRALNDQAAQDTLNMRNAAASRGILQSGIYANQLGQYNTANQQQMTNLLGGLQNTRDNAALAYNQFVANEIAAKEKAIQDAAARRSAQLGQF